MLSNIRILQQEFCESLYLDLSDKQ